jgi:predicted kinase
MSTARYYNFRYDAEVIFLVGNIGSGKSTYISTLNGTHMVISRDKIRYMLGNGEYVFIKEHERAVWAAERALFQNLLKTGVNIVIDEVNTNVIMRHMYLEDISNSPNEYTAKAIVFPRIPKKEAVNRRMINPHGLFSRKIWGQVWSNFDNERIDPSFEEGFDEIIYIESKLIDGKVVFEEIPANVTNKCPNLK